MRYTIKGKVTKYKQNIVCWRDVSAWPGQWRSFIRAHQCIFEISRFIFQSLNEWIFIIEKQKACVVCRREVTGWARQTRGRSTTWEEVGFYHCCSNTTNPHLSTFQHLISPLSSHHMFWLFWIEYYNMATHCILFFVTKDIINFCLFIFNLCLSCRTKGFFW